MLRLLLPIIAMASIAVAGCGGGASGSSSPLDNALGYLPADAPLVISLDTDVEGKQYKAAEKLMERLPFGDRLKDELEGRLEGGVSFQDDIKPMLGNEIVVGAKDASGLVEDGTAEEDDQFVAAIEVEDKDKLEQVTEEYAEPDGEAGGAKIYKDGNGSLFAIEDDVLVIAATRSQLEAALGQRGKDDRLTEKRFEKRVGVPPEGGALKLAVDIEALLDEEPGTFLSKVKWSNALRTLGATVSFGEERAELDFKVATDGGELTAEDLPFATGDDSPPALDVPGDIGVGIRDPRQVVRFLEGVGEETGMNELASAGRQLERRLKVDVEDDLLQQLQGDTALSIAPQGSVGARIELSDEAAFRRTLTKFERLFPRSSGRLTRIGDVTQIRTGGRSFAYTIDDGALIVADHPVRVNQLRRADPEDVPGANGSVSLRADALAALRNTGLYYRLGLGTLGSRALSASLGDLTGSLRTSKDGLVGNVKVDLD